MATAMGNGIPMDRNIGTAIIEEPPPDVALTAVAIIAAMNIQIDSIVRIYQI